jgi:hypothetical protein
MFACHIGTGLATGRAEPRGISHWVLDAVVHRPELPLAGPGSHALVALAVTAVGMTVALAPPSALAMAGSSLATLALVCGVAYWPSAFIQSSHAAARQPPLRALI